MILFFQYIFQKQQAVLQFSVDTYWVSYNLIQFWEESEVVSMILTPFRHQ